MFKRWEKLEKAWLCLIVLKTQWHLPLDGGNLAVVAPTGVGGWRIVFLWCLKYLPLAWSQGGLFLALEQSKYFLRVFSGALGHFCIFSPVISQKPQRAEDAFQSWSVNTVLTTKGMFHRKRWSPAIQGKGVLQGQGSDQVFSNRGLFQGQSVLQERFPGHGCPQGGCLPGQRCPLRPHCSSRLRCYSVNGCFFRAE